MIVEKKTCGLQDCIQVPMDKNELDFIQRTEIGEMFQ